MESLTPMEKYIFDHKLKQEVEKQIDEEKLKEAKQYKRDREALNNINNEF